MRDSLPALGFLAALVIVPFFISAATAWSILHFTNNGLLVGSGVVTAMLNDQDTGTDASEKVVQCPYITSAGFVEVEVEHKEYGYRGQRDCPWRIDLTA